MQPVKERDISQVFGACRAGVRPLHVRASEDRTTFTRAWKPSLTGLETLQNGGVIEVHIAGGQPAILLEVVPGE